tara:strand:+ start:852 stop:1859 length:1008 start_codon:yes stop_codon:yes gene_type:complete
MKLFFLGINIIIILIINKYKKKISNKFKLILYSDKKSIHQNESYLLGGVILIITFCLNYFYLSIYQNENYYYNFLIVVCFFLIALADDIIKISPYKRIFISTLVLIICIYFDNTLSIKTLNFYYLKIYYFPDSLFMKFLFPTLCIIILVNAFNFIDGIDGLAILVAISLITFLLIKNFLLINYIFLILATLGLLIFLNLKKSIFLGDSGNYILSIIISCILIKENYYYPNLYYAEEIFLLLLIPGIDMLRLLTKRIYNKKNPFLGDTDHLHHKLYYNFGKSRTLFIYLLIVNLPIYIVYYNKNLLGTILVLTLVFYYILIIFLSKKNTERKTRKL